MGLAASQARLLSITSRKSDCELRSMRLSHEKIAMSRDLADVSNEYQSSLDKTKLYYDYYGKNDQSTQLSYGVLMEPSTLNEYMPILITDTTGRAVLDAKYAAAARAAGIPQEGLGCLPSSDMRNKFLAGLFDQKIITYEQAQTISSIPYNQTAGVGAKNGVEITTVEGNIEELKKYLKELNGTISLSSIKETNKKMDIRVDNKSAEKSTEISLYDLFNGKEYSLLCTSGDGDRYADEEWKQMAEYTTANFIPWLFDEFSKVLDTGDLYIQDALNYAKSAVTAMFSDVDNGDNYTSKVGEYKETDSNIDCANSNDADYLGVVYTRRKKSAGGGKKNAAAALNLNNIADMFLTFFARKMDSIANSEYTVSNGKKTNSNLVTNDLTFLYQIKTGSKYTNEQMQLATFYDALFNQICQKGWGENDNVRNKEYLQEMLQSGTGYITKVNDDGYYYQGNYATDNYIKEVIDETYIAQAEAKYNTEKSKINQKEQEIDMKMKNLDTEMSSLSTEYDTVKNLISKNIEKGFKRYNA